MNSQSTTFARSPHRARRPSLASRLSFAASTAEHGEADAAASAPAERQIQEEIAEIKRYEVRERQACSDAPACRLTMRF